MAEKLEIDEKRIRELARLLEETGLNEIEVGEGERRIRVARYPEKDNPGDLARSGAAPKESGAAGGPVSAIPGESPVDADHPGAVISPVVGTLYWGPEAEAPPFVRVGDMVTEGQTLFIIEAMKVMNPIRAPRSGKVEQILVENGAPVEYGEVLLLLQ